jgi:hypothetical protein
VNKVTNLKNSFHAYVGALPPGKPGSIFGTVKTCISMPQVYPGSSELPALCVTGNLSQSIKRPTTNETGYFGICDKFRIYVHFDVMIAS